MEMEKVETWSGETLTHGFSVEIYRDIEPRLYVAKIFTYSPPGFDPYISGVENMTTHDEPEELNDEDLDQLRARTRKTVANRCGNIRTLDKVVP